MKTNIAIIAYFATILLVGLGVLAFEAFKFFALLKYVLS